MTICIYNNGSLYCDRAGLVMSKPAYYKEMQKLFIDKKKEIAIAVSGSEIIPSEKIFADLKKTALAAEAMNGSPVLSDQLKSFFEARDIIMMTARKVYISRKNENEKLAELEIETRAMIGSGSDFASIAMIAGRTPEEAIWFASSQDMGSFYTEIDKVSMKELKHFNEVK